MKGEARRNGTKIHHGRTAELCTQKNSKQPDGHPETIYKARAVLLDDNVKGEESKRAVFSNLGSSPSLLEACRALDAVSCSPAYFCKTSDAMGAYCQTYLTNVDGVVTLVLLPEHRWPQEWIDKGYNNPVVRLILRLYRHAESEGL